MSITHNKKRTPLLNFLINCISARSAPQILFIKGDCTFLLSNFRIIGLRNSSANSLLDILSFLIADLFEILATPPEVFFLKIYKPQKQVLVYIHHISDF